MSRTCLRLYGLLAALLLPAAALVLPPWWEHLQGLKSEAATAEARIRRFRALIESRPALERTLERIRREMESRGYFLRAAGPELAAAELQRQLKAMAAASGGTLVSTQRIETENDPDRLHLAARIQGSEAALSGLLESLRDHRPLVLVETFHLRDPAPRRRGGTRGAQRPLELTLHLTVPLEAPPP